MSGQDDDSAMARGNRALRRLDARILKLNRQIAQQPRLIAEAVAQAEKNARLPKPPPPDEPA